MAKVVINSSYGMYQLSDEAKHAMVCRGYNLDHLNRDMIVRHNKDLVEVVELPEGCQAYKIDEYI